jgi:hypothetical protein
MLEEKLEPKSEIFEVSNNSIDNIVTGIAKW